jgi:hypothetical protein
MHVHEHSFFQTTFGKWSGLHLIFEDSERSSKSILRDDVTYNVTLLVKLHLTSLKG